MSETSEALKKPMPVDVTVCKWQNGISLQVSNYFVKHELQFSREQAEKLYGDIERELKL